MSARVLDLTDWEKKFMGDVRQYYIRTGRISPAQKGIVDKVFGKYSDAALAEQASWEASWDKSRSLTLVRIAKYYQMNPPYFNDLVNKVLANPSGTRISKKQWDSFCENKYAKRIRLEYDSELKFKKGDCVQIRVTNRLDLTNHQNSKYSRLFCKKEGNRVGFVLSTDAQPITRASKGSRIYQVLLAGDTSPIYAHESDLKKTKSKLTR